jgi:hypothetical protein
MIGGARKAFEARIREIDREYAAGLGASAAMAEVKAALREIDRRKPRNQNAARSGLKER